MKNQKQAKSMATMTFGSRRYTALAAALLAAAASLHSASAFVGVGVTAPPSSSPHEPALSLSFGGAAPVGTGSNAVKKSFVYSRQHRHSRHHGQSRSSVEEPARREEGTTPGGGGGFDPIGLADDEGESLSSSTAAAASSSSSSSHLVAGGATKGGDPSGQGGEEGNGQLGIWAARGLLLLVAAIWGTNFASVKYFEGLCFHPPCHHPPSEAAFARFGVAALVSLPLLFKQRGDVIRAGFECGLWITLGYVSQAVALSTISSGKCAFICSLTVIVVPILGAIIYGKPIKSTDIAAAVVALAGVSVLEGLVDFNDLLGIKPALADAGTATTAAIAAAPESAAAVASSSVEAAAANLGPIGSLAKSIGVGKGDIIALGQPFGFGSAFLRIEHYQEEFKDVPNRVLTIAAAQCVAVGVLSFFWVLNDYSWTIPDFGYMIEPHRIAAIAWTGIVTTVFAIFLEGIALQTASATDAAISFATEPVWACMFGFLLLKEQLGMNSYVGGTIILVACLIGALSDLDLGGSSLAEGEEGGEDPSEEFKP